MRGCAENRSRYYLTAFGESNKYDESLNLETEAMGYLHLKFAICAGIGNT
jgi:hypothetical protein